MGRGTTAVAEKKDLTSFFATTRTANTLLSLPLSCLFRRKQAFLSDREREKRMTPRLVAPRDHARGDDVIS